VTIVSPSVLAADLLFLREEFESVVQAGLTSVHLDIMDGHFVPNLSYGLNMVHAVKRFGELRFDVHLMVTDPERYVVELAALRPEFITVHYEATNHLHRLIYRIKELGCKAGVSLNPSTSPDVLKYVWPDLDGVLIMTVNPGFGGQQFIKSMLPKISAVKDVKNELDRSLFIQVDGGINLTTGRDAVLAGATHLVAGAAFFQSHDRASFAHALQVAPE